MTDIQTEAELLRATGDALRKQGHILKHMGEKTVFTSHGYEQHRCLSSMIQHLAEEAGWNHRCYDRLGNALRVLSVAIRQSIAPREVPIHAREPHDPRVLIWFNDDCARNVGALAAVCEKAAVMADELVL